ncbi:MAG: arginase [Planctomycetia bacterium]|jgi:arginase|nr:arginase [Planctomycetia bacterium]NCF99590.1 arginase [Planctomycetia bacterium]NCG56501.1 arginase [Pseudomonadota bacterium]
MSADPIELIGVPLDHGAGRRGVSMGPSALRIAGLAAALERIELSVIDSGDIPVPNPESEDPGDSTQRYLNVVSTTCQNLCDKVHESLDRNHFPLVLGGDHSVAVGTISGVASHLKAKKKDSSPKIGVLWFDAHADLNTPETTPTGNIHGMPMASLLGKGPKGLTDIGYVGQKLDSHRIVQIGLRDLDPGERRRIKESEIQAYTMEDVDRRGLSVILEEAIQHVLSDCDHLHVSFDIDVIDPRFAPGTGTATEGGFTYREAHLAMEMVAETQKMGSLELVEVNPVLDQSNRTAEVGVAIIASALGQEILG